MESGDGMLEVKPGFYCDGTEHKIIVTKFRASEATIRVLFDAS